MYDSKKDEMIERALDNYHTYDVTMEEAMDMAVAQDQKDSAVEAALDIYHTYDVTMEEAMSMVLNDGANNYDKDAVVEAALDIYHTYDVTMEEAMSMALEAPKVSGYPGDVSITVNKKNRIPTAERDYHDLWGAQRGVMQGILKWIDDYNLLPPDSKAKAGVASKIVKAINDPIIRNLMMKSGYWDRVPEEIRAMNLQKHVKKYDKLGYQVERKNMKVQYSRDKKAKKQEAKTAKKAAKLAAKRAAWEAACATADELRISYPSLTNDEAISMAMEELGYTYDDVDFDNDDYTEDYDY